MLFLNWKPLLCFHLLYSALFAVVLYSLFNFLLRLSLKLVGYSFLNNANIGKFFTTIPGILMVVILALFAAFFSLLDACLLFNGFQASLAGQRASFKQLVFHGIHEYFKSFRFKDLYFALPLFAFNLISSLFVLYEAIFAINPLDTFLPKLIPTTASRVGACVLLVLIAMFAVYQVFSACCRYIGERSWHDSVKESPRLALKHIFVVLRNILILNVLVALTCIVLKLILQLITVLAVSFLAPNDLKVAMALSINNTISLGLIWVGIVTVFFLGLALLTREYYRFSGQNVIREIRFFKPSIPKRFRKYVAAGIALVCAGFAIFLYYGFYNGIITSERALTPIQIICHRGLSSEAPENTVPAFEKAIDAMADMVELDVQETSDGVVVVSHDTNLRRTAGKNVNIASLTYEELETYDVGSFFSAEYAGTRIPTLAEVMETCKGRVNMLIELKRNSASEDLAQKVVDLIAEYDMEHQCVIQSVDYNYLKQVHELNPDLTLGYILTTAIGDYYNDEMVDFFCVRSLFINETAVTNAHAEGKAIYAWTIDSRAEAERMKSVSVDAIITNYPAKAREVIYRGNGSESLLNLLKLVL